MIDLVGEKYGRLTVVEFDRLQNHKTYWKCVCDCGLTVIATGNNLRSGNTQSCGCLHREKVADIGRRNAGHGESHNNRTRLYTIWCGMRQRCNNPNRAAYKLYGGKGVKLCDEWNDYSKFREWAYANGCEEPKPGQSKGDMMSIDRVDPDKAYSPDNCRWVSLRQNVSYMRKSHANQR